MNLTTSPSEMLSALQAEIRRNALRARNGIKYVTSPGVPTGTTPKDVVWKRDRVELWRYRSERVTCAPPLLLFLGLVSRSTVLDLTPGNSFVAALRDAGFDVFLLDWGVPGDADAANTLETYVDEYLPGAVAALLEESGARELSVLGYCMGGCFSLLLLAGHPELPIRNLVTMATPVDFSKMGEHLEPVRSGSLDPDLLVDDGGNVPPDVIRSYFRLRKPTADLVQYANLWENLWSDAFMEGYQAMGQWVRDQLPFPGAAMRQVITSWLRDNAFMNGTLRLGRRRLDLRSIRCPLLCVVAEKDDIVPVAAAEPLPSLVGSVDVTAVRLEAGHVGLAMGRHAARITLPKLVEWLRRHGEEEDRRHANA